MIFANIRKIYVESRATRPLTGAEKESAPPSPSPENSVSKSDTAAAAENPHATINRKIARTREDSNLDAFAVPRPPEVDPLRVGQSV